VKGLADAGIARISPARFRELARGSVEPSAFCTGLSREPSDGNGCPLASPDAFSAS
jgi:hypothetical protein